MMADEAFGPSFRHLDGCNMDDDNFDIHRRKREEWKEEQREWEALSRKMDAQWAERQRLGVSYPHSGEDDSDSVWKKSLALKLMQGGSRQVEYSEEGLMTDDIAACRRPVIRAVK